MRSAKKIAKEYIKKVSCTCLRAFEMGYADGKSGERKKLPPLPPKEDDARVYALCLFTQELYKDGFEAGTSVRKRYGSV